MTNKTSAPLLIEIGCEELPPKSLKRMMLSLVEHFSAALDAAQFSFDGIEGFATPRRLAVRVDGLATVQPTQHIEKRGPSTKAAFDSEGNPSKALKGFLGSLGLDSADALETQETEKGSWLVYKETRPGLPLEALIEDILTQALSKLPIDRRMHWGSNRAEFVRPVHWLVALHGDKVLPLSLFGITAGNESRGHRFMANHSVPLKDASEYESKLNAAFVVVNFETRRAQIAKQLTNIEEAQNLNIVVAEELLDEVTALVEWPVALLGNFDPSFLEVPEQALISAMKEHQRYFHVIDKRGALLPMFVTIANIASENEATVISGNERVIRPRLSDAAFFFTQDQKTPLEDKLSQLKNIVFQKDLGTYHDKVLRVSKLAGYLATLTGADKQAAERAGLLCKADLVTNMVGEFPDLQGTMGAHYARHDNEDAAVCEAIGQHYQPTGAGGDLPESLVSRCVAIADKLDTLTGLFGAGQPPTGSRDPFALRRQAIGIIRMCVEGQMAFDLMAAVEKSNALHDKGFGAEKVGEYLVERVKSWYQESGSRFDSVNAILQESKSISDLVEVDHKIRALEAFRDQPEAEKLIAANKRVVNILKKLDNTDSLPAIDQALFTPAETILYEAIKQTELKLNQQDVFADKLLALSDLKAPLEQYFEDVMVMVDDMTVRNNRLATLLLVRNMCFQIADLSLLQQ